MRNLGRQNIILVQVFLFVCRYLSLLPRRSNIDLRLRMAIALSKKSLQSCIELHNWCLLLWMFFCQQFVWIMFLVSARSKFPSFPLILSLSKSLLCTRARSFTVCIFGACSSLLRRVGSASPPRQWNSSNVPCCVFLGPNRYHFISVSLINEPCFTNVFW